jgi:hypothetical protein
MKNLILLAALFMLTAADALAQQYQYAVVTTIESIIPAGLGRSRMISNAQDLDPANFTTKRTDGMTSEMGSVKRSDIKIDEFEETKMLNFYSIGGINFQNVASNDALITGKLNEMAKVGWELAFVSTGVESDSGKDDNEGIFVTRYVFKRLVPETGE